jgi:hypothetical protein
MAKKSRMRVKSPNIVDEASRLFTELSAVNDVLSRLADKTIVQDSEGDDVDLYAFSISVNDTLDDSDFLSVPVRRDLIRSALFGQQEALVTSLNNLGILVQSTWLSK